MKLFIAILIIDFTIKNIELILLNLGLILSRLPYGTAENLLSGENNIQAVYERGNFKGKIIAWKCVFPIKSNIKSRQFSFSIDNIVESREALKQATKYRDLSIKC